MKSPFTGKEMILVRENRQMTFRKEEFDFVHHAYRCEETEEQFTTTELDNLNIFQVYNQYREKHNIPFPEEIRQIRDKYGVSAAKMSEILGFGANSYRLYEDGEVPQLSNARSIQGVKSPSSFKNLVNLCDSLEMKYKQNLIEKIERIEQEERKIVTRQNIESYLFGEPCASKYTGYKIPNIDKLAAMVFLFASAMKPYKTKLNKLLFYADFAMFKNYCQSISGIRYRAIPMGPVPNNFQSIFEYFQTKGIINIEYTEFPDGNVAEQYFPVETYQLDPSIFSEEEFGIIKDVIETFKKDKTQDIIKKSHDEKPWLNNKEQKSIISYFDGFELKHI